MTPSAVSGEDNVALFLRRIGRVLPVLVAVLDQQFRVRALLEVWLLRGVVCLAVLMLIEFVQFDGFEQVRFEARSESPQWLLTGVVLLAVLVLLELVQLDGFEQVMLGKRTESSCWRWSAPGSVGDGRVDAAPWLRSGAARKEDGKSSLALNSGGAPGRVEGGRVEAARRTRAGAARARLETLR